jgi:hypothetical protein
VKAGDAVLPASPPTLSGVLSLVFLHLALNSDPSDPDIIIKLDISNAFNALCRQLTLDVLGSKASCDYACGLKDGDNIETVCGELRNMFEYFRTGRMPRA